MYGPRNLPASALLVCLVGLLSLTLAACDPDPRGDGPDGSHTDDEEKPVVGLDVRPSPGACVPQENPPERLSETGCYTGTPPVPAAGLIPYDVAVPLWSDGTGKGRYVAIPDDGTLTPLADGRIDFPPGTVLVKEFAKGERRLETRFLVRKADSTYAAYTYAWTEDQQDALLVDEGGTTIDWDGGSWSVPRRTQCFSCHKKVAGVVLGPEIAQLNNEIHYEATGRTAHQLVTWDALGLFDPTLGEVTKHPAFPAPNDESASVESRARAYLHANCANCHRPGGPMSLDLRASTKLHLMNVCDVYAENSSPEEIPDARLLVPGEPDKSVLLLRMNTTDFAWRMPSIGTTEVDEEGVALVAEWIRSIASCE